MGNHEAPRSRVETKVWAATGATFVASGLLAVLNDVQAHPNLLGSMSPVLQSVLITLAPTLATFLSGYVARHTPRDPKAQTQ